MNSAVPIPDLRADQVDAIVHDLVPYASQLTRLALRRARVPRSEGGILRSLSDGPKRVTELAELEGLAQPTTTALLNRMERAGWVTRDRDASDRRAVRVSLTADGARALQELRAQYRTVLRDRLAALSDEQLAILGEAIEPLSVLVASLQQGDPR